MTRRLLRVAVRRLWPLELFGFDSVPAGGPVILCPNHLSFFDSVLMMVTVQRPVHFIGKVDYLDSWTTRWLFPALGMIPIDRDNGSRAMIGLDAAAGVLGDGGVLCVFPEGSRSRDGRLHRGYPGAARLAMTVDCPILPVGICGTREIQPPGARLPRPGRACSITIGHPLTAVDEGTGRKLAARALTDQLMAQIAELSGQDYVGEYTKRTNRNQPGRDRPPARNRTLRPARRTRPATTRPTLQPVLPPLRTRRTVLGLLRTNPTQLALEN